MSISEKYRERYKIQLLVGAKYAVGKMLDFLTEVPENHYSAVEFGEIDTEKKTVTLTYTYIRIPEEEND